MCVCLVCHCQCQSAVATANDDDDDDKIANDVVDPRDSRMLVLPCYSQCSSLLSSFYGIGHRPTAFQLVIYCSHDLRYLATRSVL